MNYISTKFCILFANLWHLGDKILTSSYWYCLILHGGDLQLVVPMGGISKRCKKGIWVFGNAALLSMSSTG